MCHLVSEGNCWSGYYGVGWCEKHYCSILDYSMYYIFPHYALSCCVVFSGVYCIGIVTLVRARLFM
jgi:hypothetical protein